MDGLKLPCEFTFNKKKREKKEKLKKLQCLRCFPVAIFQMYFSFTHTHTTQKRTLQL